MSKLVSVHAKELPGVDFAAYDEFKKGTARALRALAKPVRDMRVIHVNATAQGGGVAELLKSQIPFERTLGIRSHWYALRAPKRFFRITKQLHDLLQGRKGRLGSEERDLYLAVGREIGRELAVLAEKLRPDLVVLHDPQPLPAITALPAKVRAVVRLHGDFLTPNPQTLEFVRPFLFRADRVVVSNRAYAASMPWLSRSRTAVIYPAIDPLSPKNRPLSPEVARRLLEEFSINTTKPIVSQVSRFDPWKDPLGVIKAYYLAKNQIPNLQLVLAGLFIAKDDPEAVEIFEQVKRHAKGDPDIFLFADPKRLHHLSNGLFASAIYTASVVVVQKSIREGFGLTMTEAMWKGKAVVAGKTSGALIQIKNRKNGLLVSSSEEAARAIVSLAKNEKLRMRLGRAARESVRRNFLMPRFVADNLRLYAALRK